MKNTFFLLLLPVTVFFLSASTGGFAFRQLGNYPNAFATYPRSLNVVRTVVGLYQPPGGFYHGYIQEGNNYKTVEPPGALASYIEGINDKGVTVGGYCDTASCNGGSSQHGYLFGKDKFTKVDYPGTGYSTAPQGVNNAGEVVGGYCPALTCPGGATPSAYAFLFQKGVFTTINFPGAIATQANAINDAESIVGIYLDSTTNMHGYLYQAGAFTELNFPSSQWTIPLGINNANTISGIYEDNTTLITHGFTYANGVFTRVDVPNSTATGVGGINNKGDVTATANVNGVSTTFMGVPVR